MRLAEALVKGPERKGWNQWWGRLNIQVTRKEARKVGSGENSGKCLSWFLSELY
jgi:hypothetical protein